MMEIFGGFMVMMSIIGLFLAVVWLAMPFLLFAVKGKQDRILELLERIQGRLDAIEEQCARQESPRPAELSLSAEPLQHAESEQTPPHSGNIEPEHPVQIEHDTLKEM